MQDYKIIRYSSEYFQEWNDFILKAKNGTFLFHRNFIEYHKDRFQDFSLMIFKDKKLLAVLPANIVGDTIYSHQGLSYGGLVFKNELKLNKIIEIFESLLRFLFEKKIPHLELKTLPSIYSKTPNDEITYLMFLLKAKLTKQESLSVINLNHSLKIDANRMEGFRRGNKSNLKIKEDDSLRLFWESILIPNLLNKHSVKPVHTLDEIRMLKDMFPENIKQFNVFHEGDIVAGTTLFITDNTVKAQYISGNSKNNTLGSIDYLFVNLLDRFKDNVFFDLGSSNLSDGMQINKGLQYWKEGLGARTIVQNFYKIEVENYALLGNVLV
ncbi:GNAT family N-acetyltransferase [Seonamhaeicola sp. ML3]|uniref:GNAT family N-acetyltransferase n=1 Tax=Seonamhaeicola sp. ML3 TaxID=2937786 RepID=UPI00200C3D63|nr:GNAT family N-acetyltransferase [Seonamhaeicola sp. ML3]